MEMIIYNCLLNEIPNVSSCLKILSQDIKVITFEGIMGSGKTTLIKSFCNLLNCIDNINSPTYSLVNEYHTNDNKIVDHFDFYRIKDISEALDIGIEEYLTSGNLCLIEWPDKIESLLPKSLIKVHIESYKEMRNYTFTQKL